MSGDFYVLIGSVLWWEVGCGCFVVLLVLLGCGYW